jgi:hypothetical protein
MKGGTMPVIQVPDRRRAKVKRVSIDVSTGKGEAKVTDKFEADLPLDVGSAVAIFGEEHVLRCFIGYHVIELQAKERLRLQKQNRSGGSDGTAGRKRGRYLDEIGL